MDLSTVSLKLKWSAVACSPVSLPFREEMIPLTTLTDAYISPTLSDPGIVRTARSTPSFATLRLKHLHEDEYVEKAS